MTSRRDPGADWLSADDVIATSSSAWWKPVSTAWSATSWTRLLCRWGSCRARVDDVGTGTRYPTLQRRQMLTCRVGHKKRGHRLMTIILSNLNRFTNFFTGRFLSKFAVKWILKIPPLLAYVATIPCETLMSAKQAIIDKLQDSVATHLRCGRVVNKQIKNGLLLSVRIKM